VVVENVVTELSTQEKGAFTDPYVAGNVGTGVLKRVNIIFDSGKQQLIFERNANDERPDVYDRSGMWINLRADGFEVMDVVAGGTAAEAGLKGGDTIIAIDGQPTTDMSLPATRVRLKTEPPGTKLQLQARSGDGTREVTLVLRDLV
jgi:C-terminal processing protease CtpA/Prc